MCCPSFSDVHFVNGKMKWSKDSLAFPKCRGDGIPVPTPSRSAPSPAAIGRGDGYPGRCAMAPGTLYSAPKCTLDICGSNEDDYTWHTFALRYLSAKGGSELSHTNLNFSMNYPACMWNIHVITYNAFTECSQRNLSGRPRQLTDCAWAWGIFDESHQYKTPKSIG